MTLISALGSALTGMQASQRAADLVSRNVANATTDGYTKKVLPRDSLVLAGQGAGVVTGEVQRQLDLRVQAQMWVEQSSSARLDVVDDFLQRGRPAVRQARPGPVAGLLCSAAFDGVPGACGRPAERHRPPVGDRRRRRPGPRPQPHVGRGAGDAARGGAGAGPVGRHGERRAAEHSPAQPGDLEAHRRRRHGRRSRGPARRPDRPAVGADGHSSVPAGWQPDRHLHAGRPAAARRHRRGSCSSTSGRTSVRARPLRRRPAGPSAR